LIIIDTR